MNLGSIKIHKISLLNQSGFKFSLKKVYVNQNKIDALKELMMNRKNTQKPFDIYFTPVQNINSNNFNKENNFKQNRLAEKSKIVKKHNILQKIDFNANIFKNPPTKNISNFSMITT